MKAYEVIGYCHEGAAWHPECLHEDFDKDEASPVFALDEWDDFGLTCDRCLEYIIEPTARGDHELGVHEDVTPENMGDLGCEYCEQYLSDHELHANDVYNVTADIIPIADWCETCYQRLEAMTEAHDDFDHSIMSGNPDRECPWCPDSWFKVVR